MVERADVHLDKGRGMGRQGVIERNRMEQQARMRLSLNPGTDGGEGGEAEQKVLGTEDEHDEGPGWHKNIGLISNTQLLKNRRK